MGIEEASKTMRRRLEMINIGNNMGNGIVCECGEKETSEHIVECRGKKEVKVEWLKETDDLRKIRSMNALLEEAAMENKTK